MEGVDLLVFILFEGQKKPTHMGDFASYQNAHDAYELIGGGGRGRYVRL